MDDDSEGFLSYDNEAEPPFTGGFTKLLLEEEEEENDDDGGNEFSILYGDLSLSVDWNSRNNDAESDPTASLRIVHSRDTLAFSNNFQQQRSALLLTTIGDSNASNATSSANQGPLELKWEVYTQDSPRLSDGTFRRQRPADHSNSNDVCELHWGDYMRDSPILQRKPVCPHCQKVPVQKGVSMEEHIAVCYKNTISSVRAKCNIEGCKVEETFAKAPDLQRHIASKHPNEVLKPDRRRRAINTFLAEHCRIHPRQNDQSGPLN